MHNFQLLLFFDDILSPFEFFPVLFILFETFRFLVKYSAVMVLPISFRHFLSVLLYMWSSEYATYYSFYFLTFHVLNLET